MIRVALLLALATGVAAAQPKAKPPAVTAAKLLADVEANYKKPAHFAATFDQTVTNAISGTAAPSLGTLSVEKPDKLKFVFLQPKKADPKPKMTYLVDGKTMWVLDHSNKRFGERAAADSELPSLVAFFLGAGSLSTDFTVALATDPAFVPAGADALELTSKKPSAAYAKIVLVLDAKRMVTQAAIINSSGNVQTMKFTSVTLDKPAPAGTFVIDRKAIAGWAPLK